MMNLLYSMPSMDGSRVFFLAFCHLKKGTGWSQRVWLQKHYTVFSYSSGIFDLGLQKFYCFFSWNRRQRFRNYKVSDVK
jgi:hypothetical protein